jgi:hypothetical protein
VKYLILLSLCVIILGETKGGEPVPLRQSEVNRMLGKVDELAVSRYRSMKRRTKTHIPHNFVT